MQTVSPLPITWAEHVAAQGHWGRALRDYMSDYVHWACLGSLCEFLSLAGNRVTLDDETDCHDMPVARFAYSQCDNDRALMEAAQHVMEDILTAAGADEVITIKRYVPIFSNLSRPSQVYGTAMTTLSGHLADPRTMMLPFGQSVSITVNGTPIAVNDAYTVQQNSANNSLNVLVNDSDPDGNALTVAGSFSRMAEATLIWLLPSNARLPVTIS